MLCTDCIHKEVCGLEGCYDEALIICKYKEEIPQNKGHWIRVGTPYISSVPKTYHWECSECGNYVLSETIYYMNTYYHYCNKCGAKMKEMSE